MSAVALSGLALGAVLGIRAAWRAARTRRALRAIEAARVKALPGAVVLLQIAIVAGRSPRGAIDAVGRLSVGGDLGIVVNDFAVVAEKLGLGASLSDAILASDPREQSASMTRVLDLLRRAEIDGAALGLQLELLVRDLRAARALSLDAAAQRMTVSLLFPLVLCILPAFILLAIVPLLLGALAGLPG